MTRRVLVLLVALAALSALAGGCGGGEGTGGTTSAAKAEAIEKVGAADYAREVNLRASDVPYFEQSDDEEEEDPEVETRRETGLERCLGVEFDSDEDLASVDSPTFESQLAGGLIEVSSTVSVGPDEDEVARELALLRSRLAERCLRRYFLELLEEEETPSAEASGSELKRIPFPDPEIDDAFAYRFGTTVTVHPDTSAPVAYRPAATPPSRSVDIYIDLVGFVVGPASVTLTAVGAPTPVSRTLERNLLALLHERATAASPRGRGS